MEDAHPQEEELSSREPTVEDLADLCRRLNELGARYLIIGGFAIRGVGYIRNTMGVDLLFLRKWFEARGETPPD